MLGTVGPCDRERTTQEPGTIIGGVNVIGSIGDLFFTGRWQAAQGSRLNGNRKKTRNGAHDACGEREMAALVLLAATAASAGGAPDTWMTLRNHQHFEALSEHIGANSVLVSGFFTDEGATALALFKEAHDAQGSILAGARMAHRPWIFTRSFNRVLSAELCEEAAESQVAGEDFDNCLLLQKSSADGSGGWVAARMNARDLDDVRSFLIEHAGHEVGDFGSHGDEL